MEPLFDARCNHVGWINPDAHIFDTDLNWVAFIARGQAWSAKTGNRLGPVDNLNCLDRDGRPVAWNPKQPVKGVLPSLQPVRMEPPSPPPVPVRPMRPMKKNVPPEPMGGWSPVRWKLWLAQ